MTGTKTFHDCGVDKPQESLPVMSGQAERVFRALGCSPGRHGIAAQGLRAENARARISY